MRVAIDETRTLSKIFEVEGAATNNGAVTVTVKDLDNVTVASGSATNTSNVYTFALPAQSTLGKLKVVWAGTKTESYYVEIVGNHIFDIAKLRSRLSASANKNSYTDDQLRAIRDIVADRFDSICGTNFLPRRRRELVDARGTYGPVASYGLTQVITVNGTAFSGTTRRTGIYGLPAWQTASVVYEAQETADGTVDDDISNAAIEYALELLGHTKSNIPSNVETLTTDGGTYRMVVPGQRGSETGVPRVDTVLNNYMRFTGSKGAII